MDVGEEIGEVRGIGDAGAAEEDDFAEVGGGVGGGHDNGRVADGVYRDAGPLAVG